MVGPSHGLPFCGSCHLHPPSRQGSVGTVPQAPHRLGLGGTSLPIDVVVGFYRVTCAEQARHLEGPWVLSSCTQLSFRKSPGARALTQLSPDLRGRGTTSRKASFYGAFLSSSSMPGAPPCAPSSQPLSAGEGNAGTAQPLPALLDKGTQPTRPLRHSPA